MIYRNEDPEPLQRPTTRIVVALLLSLVLAGCGEISAGGPSDGGPRPGEDGAPDQDRPSDGVAADPADVRPESAIDAAEASVDLAMRADAGAAEDGAPPDGAPSSADGAVLRDAQGDVLPADATPSPEAGGPRDGPADLSPADGPPPDGGTVGGDAATDGPTCPQEIRRGWNILAGGLRAANSAPGVGPPMLVVTTTDRPTLAWAEDARIRAVEWIPQDCAFELMGLPRLGTDPSLAAAANDRVVMASVQDLAGPTIFIETFDGSNWVRIYDPLAPTSPHANMGSTQIELDGAGWPVVAWIESVPLSPRLQVARWNGAAWQRLSDASGVLGVSPRIGQTPNGLTNLSFDLVLGHDGQPIVSWRTANGGPTVARFDGNQWSQLGASLPDTLVFSSADISAPILRVDPSGSIYVVWSHLVTNRYSANVARWTGTAWLQLGGALATAPGSMTEYGMVIDGGDAPIVASVEVLAPPSGQQIFTYRWNGAGWTSPAQPLDDHDPPDLVVWPSIIVDHAGRWLVTWVGVPSVGDLRSVYLARYTP
jgi:hypothetical protein